MNFKTILLFATAFTFAFSNGLDITEAENGVGIPIEAPLENAVADNVAAAAAENAAIESEIDDTNANEASPEIGTDESINEPPAVANEESENDADAVDVKDDSNAAEVAADAIDSEEENVPAADGQKIDDYDAADGKDGEKADDKEKDGEDKDAAEESDEEDKKGNGAAVAAGLAGAASVASAGIFFWVRKSKRASVEKFSSMNLV